MTPGSGRVNKFGGIEPAPVCRQNRPRAAARARLSMEKQLIDSSVIASVEYDAQANTMDVEFRSGRVYRYFLITPSVHRELMSADSVGKYFNASIRNRFPNRELRNLS